MELSQLTSLLAELQARVEHATPHMRPFEIELDYPVPRAGASKQGTGTAYYKATFDVTPEGFELFMHGLPHGCTLKGILWVEHEPSSLPEKPAKGKSAPKAAKPAKGEYGQFWRLLYQRNVHAIPELQHAIGTEGPEATWAALHDYFDASSLSLVAPEQFRDWAQANKLDAVLTVTEQAYAQWREMK